MIIELPPGSTSLWHCGLGPNSFVYPESKSPAENRGGSSCAAVGPTGEARSTSSGGGNPSRTCWPASATNPEHHDRPALSARGRRHALILRVEWLYSEYEDCSVYSRRGVRGGGTAPRGAGKNAPAGGPAGAAGARTGVSTSGGRRTGRRAEPQPDRDSRLCSPDKQREVGGRAGERAALAGRHRTAEGIGRQCLSTRDVGQDRSHRTDRETATIQAPAGALGNRCRPRALRAPSDPQRISSATRRPPSSAGRC